MTERPAGPRVPIPRRRRIWLMILVHPLELALASALVVNGIRGIAGDLTSSLAALPTLPIVVYLVISTGGGAAVGVALFLQTAIRTTDLGVVIEGGAIALVGTSYAGLALLLVATNGASGIGVAVVSLLVGAGCGIRAYAVRITSDITLHQLRMHHERHE